MNIIKVGFIQCSSSDNLGNSRSQSYHFSPLVYGGATISLGQSEVTHPEIGPFANAYIPSFYKTDQFGNETRISNDDRSACWGENISGVDFVVTVFNQRADTNFLIFGD